jgi:hypothetical protein
MEIQTLYATESFKNQDYGPNPQGWHSNEWGAQKTDF